MDSYETLLARGKARYGDRFAPSDLVPRFVPFYESGERVKVSDNGWERTGTVGVTTGWKPAFLLMHRSNAIGSWDVLSERDEVIAVKVSRAYRPLVGR